MARAVLPVLAALLLLGAAEPPPAAPRPPDLARVRSEGGRLVAPAGTGTVALTLDPPLQRDAERLLDEAHPQAGAVVAVEVKTGHLLAWAERRRDGRGPSVIT